MLGSYRAYDADAYLILAPAMWEELQEKFVPRRSRPASVSDSGDMATYTSGWLIEGRVELHVLGPGLQPADMPALGGNFLRACLCQSFRQVQL